MVRFIAWRCVEVPLILAVIYVLTFLLAWVAPGSSGRIAVCLSGAATFSDWLEQLLREHA